MFSSANLHHQDENVLVLCSWCKYVYLKTHQAPQIIDQNLVGQIYFVVLFLRWRKICQAQTQRVHLNFALIYKSYQLQEEKSFYGIDLRRATRTKRTTRRTSNTARSASSVNSNRANRNRRHRRSRKMKILGKYSEHDFRIFRRHRHPRLRRHHLSLWLLTRRQFQLQGTSQDREV